MMKFSISLVLLLCLPLCEQLNQDGRCGQHYLLTCLMGKRETAFVAQVRGEDGSLAFEGSRLAPLRSIGVINEHRLPSLRLAYPAAQVRFQPSALDDDDSRWSLRDK
jgi:hypothetical protein